MENNKSVSVLLITYNHEMYIEQALQSILKQTGDVLKEIIVGEDFSTDRTREIIDAYVVRYPDLIKPIYRDSNIGLTKNFVEGLKACTGKYIAILSADDYWIDLEKLEYQSSFLENNSDYMLISNAVISYYEDKFEWHLRKVKASSEDRNLFDLFLFNDISAGQSMFRNLKNWNFPDIYFDNRGEDRQLWMILSVKGKLMNDFSRITGVYRRHSNSITMSAKITRIEGYKTRIRNNQLWAEHFDVSENPKFHFAQSTYQLKLVKEYLKSKQISKARKELKLIRDKRVFENESFLLKHLSKF